MEIKEWERERAEKYMELKKQGKLTYEIADELYISKNGLYKFRKTMEEKGVIPCNFEYQVEQTKKEKIYLRYIELEKKYPSKSKKGISEMMGISPNQLRYALRGLGIPKNTGSSEERYQIYTKLRKEFPNLTVTQYAKKLGVYPQLLQTTIYRVEGRMKNGETTKETKQT
jgi:hypothetical protein